MPSRCGGDHDADIHARTLIKKHLRKEGDAIKKRRRKKGDALRGISSDMRLLIFASQNALSELDDAKDQGFGKGEAWDRWIGQLTSLAKAHNLPRGVRKDVDKQYGSDAASPFVKLIWELQRAISTENELRPSMASQPPSRHPRDVPAAHCRTHSKSALAVAIVAARRRNRVG